MVEKIQLVTLDIAILVLYFIVILATGVFAMFRSNRNSVKGYFLAGRYMTWLPVGASLFASNIGSEHFIGLAGSGAAKGIAVGAFEFNAAILLQLLGWVFLPVYISSGVCTLPEYMKKRFGGTRIQLYLTVLSLLLYIFTKISVNLYSGSLFIKESIGWNIWYAIIFILAMTAIITLTGGLTAVLYTDLVQCIIMLVGAILLTGFGFHKIGGFVGLLDTYGKSIDPINATSTVGGNLLVSMSAVANAEIAGGMTPSVASIAASPNISSQLSCSLPSSKAFVMLRGISDSEMPWLGFLFGQTPASIWYWCADQMMVQRVLAAKNLSHAQGATLMAGFIKLIPLFIMVMPGMISRVLYPETIGCSTPEDCLRVCNNKYGCSDWAYPKLVMGVMPQGLRGLMLAVMLAALMSDLTSIFNSSSTLFTVDIYTRIRKQAGNRELMIVGRLFVLLMCGLSILWVPVIQSMQGGQLYVYIQSISGFLAPPIASVYLMAILWKRNNELGAFTGLIYGFLLGVTRMVLSFVYSDPVCGEIDTRPWIVANIHYMYFAMFSFFTTGILMAIVSLCSTPPTEDQIRGLTFWTHKQSIAPSSRVDLVDSYSNSFWSSDKRGVGDGDNTGEVLPATNLFISEANADNKETTLQSNGEHEMEVIFRKNNFYVTTDTNEIDDENASPPTRNEIAAHVCEWICGLTERPCPVGVDDRYCCCLRDPVDEEDINDDDDDDGSFTKDEKAAAVASKISLEQKQSAKIGLYVGLFLISCLTIFLYLFFTFFFGDLVQGPVPTKSSAFISDLAVSSAVTNLKNLGIINLV